MGYSRSISKLFKKNNTILFASYDEYEWTCNYQCGDTNDRFFGRSLKKEFNELIHMNLFMVLYLIGNQVD